MITDVAHTPVGVFKIYREYTDGWEFGQLGELYRPKYFKGGVAIHGHGNVPNVPASHGCVRISLEAMDWMWANDVLPRGMRVWVHD
jgi:lipoprotein-anchoring transpeptidase ErfK/SrfK